LPELVAALTLSILSYVVSDFILAKKLKLNE